MGKQADTDPTDRLSVSDVARELGYRTETIRRWIREGFLPAQKDRRDWWVHRDDVDRVKKMGLQKARGQRGPK